MEGGELCGSAGLCRWGSPVKVEAVWQTVRDGSPGGQVAGGSAALGAAYGGREPGKGSDWCGRGCGVWGSQRGRSKGVGWARNAVGVGLGCRLELAWLGML